MKELRFAKSVVTGVARKKVARSLSRLPRPPLVRPGDHATHRLREILRKVGLRNQRDEAQPFYSVRAVAEHFRVSLSTVSYVYSQLEKDGILSRLRGSKTLLQGCSWARQLRVQGTVALPMSLSSLITRQDYRTFFMRMRRALRVHGFVGETFHFEDRDLATGDFAKRIRRQRMDAVVWFLPEPASRETIARLRDGGLRIVAIGDRGWSAVPCHYEVRRKAALRRVLRSWKGSGTIDRVVVFSIRDRWPTAHEEKLHSFLKEEGWAFQCIALSKKSPDLPLPSVTEGSGIFLPARAASLLSFRLPDGLIELLRRRRVALVDGPVSLPFGRFPADAQLDLIQVNWRAIAECVVQDLMKVEKAAGATTFEADALLRVAPADYAQRI